MTNRKICLFLAGALLTGLLTGCGDGSEEALNESSGAHGMPEAVQMEGVAATAEPEQEQETTELKAVYSTGELTEEEEAEVLESMKTLQQNLQLEEYLGEAIHMVSGAEWFETMTPGLYEGCRSYTLQQGGKVLLSVQVGYDIAGDTFSNVFFPAEDGSVIVLKQQGSKVSLMQAGVSEGKYDGAFVTWQIDGAAGEIRKEEGTYSKGVLVGEYTESVYQGAAGDNFDLWTNRENMAYETSTITYDEQGEPVATATPVPTAAPTKKPSATPKPAVNPTPVPTAAPTQPPVQQPDNNDNDDDDDNDNNDNNNNDNGGGAAGGSTDNSSEPTIGGDTDIGWSSDIL